MDFKKTGPTTSFQTNEGSKAPPPVEASHQVPSPVPLLPPPVDTVSVIAQIDGVESHQVPSPVPLLPPQVDTSSVVAQIDGQSPEGVALPSEVRLGAYLIKLELSPILQGILDRYGDICAECHLKGAFFRSKILESICRVIASMQQKTLNDLTREDLSEWKIVVKDFSQVGVMVSWLTARIEELSVASEVVKCLNEVNEERMENLSAFDTVTEVEGALKSELVEAEAQLEVAKARVASLREDVAALILQHQALEEQKKDVMGRYDPVHQEAEVFRSFVEGDLAQGLL